MLLSCSASYQLSQSRKKSAPHAEQVEEEGLRLREHGRTQRVLKVDAVHVGRDERLELVLVTGRLLQERGYFSCRLEAEQSPVLVRFQQLAVKHVGLDSEGRSRTVREWH